MADELLTGIQVTMGELSEEARLTVTWDQGSEMAGHNRIAELFGEFSAVGRSWQRLTHEKTNGLSAIAVRIRLVCKDSRSTPTDRHRSRVVSSCG